MIYCFDLDGVLCTHEEDYSKAQPFMDRIEVVNKLYNEGHKILVDTARGSVTGINHRKLTKSQLDRWGLKYHKLRVGKKLFANLYVDDHAESDKVFFELR